MEPSEYAKERRSDSDKEKREARMNIKREANVKSDQFEKFEKEIQILMDEVTEVITRHLGKVKDNLAQILHEKDAQIDVMNADLNRLANDLETQNRKNEEMNQQNAYSRNVAIHRKKIQKKQKKKAELSQKQKITSYFKTKE